MSTHCERCGAPARHEESASHVFCDACTARASTGQRASSELLFSTQRPPAPAKAEDDSLDTLTAMGTRERVSLPHLGTITMAVPTVRPPSRARWLLRTLLPITTMAASAVLFAGSAWMHADTKQRERHIVSVAEAALIADDDRPSKLLPPSEPAASLPFAPPSSVEPSVVEAPIAPSAEPAAETPAVETERRRVRRAPRPAVQTAPAPREEERREPAPPEEEPLEEVLSRPMLPSRSEVSAAMSRLSSRVDQCGDGGTATARVTFSSSGRVASAEITGDGVAPEVKSCIARVVRDASVSPFAQERFTVAFPYRI
jgi:hypothetical protein